MTDDYMERRRKLADDFEMKARWGRELHRRTDANGKLTPEDANEARKAVGLEPLPEQLREEVPADLHAQIREAERVGDVERAFALKSLQLRATRR